MRTLIRNIHLWSGFLNCASRRVNAPLMEEEKPERFRLLESLILEARAKCKPV